MEITPELLEAITRQVLCTLQRQPTSPVRPTALLFGNSAGWNALSERFALAGEADYQGTAEPFELLLIDGVTGAQLADMALGRDDAALSCAVSGALLVGKPVYLAVEGLAHRAFKGTANPRYYAMLEEYVTRLSQFGVRIGSRKELAEQICGQPHGSVKEAENTSASTIDIICGLVTEDRARMLARDCGGRLLLAQGAMLTPLARDLLREKKILLEWQKEETVC